MRRDEVRKIIDRPSSKLPAPETSRRDAMDVHTVDLLFVWQAGMGVVVSLLAGDDVHVVPASR